MFLHVLQASASLGLVPDNITFATIMNPKFASNLRRNKLAFVLDVDRVKQVLSLALANSIKVILRAPCIIATMSYIRAERL